MNSVDRLGERLFAFLGALAWICAVVGLVALISSGWDASWPWFRGALLCALPAYSPRLMAALFGALASRKNSKVLP